MPFIRTYPEDFPCVYSKWVDNNGATWTIQDLPPEDDQKAIDVLVAHLCTDEVLCKESNIVGDPESVQGMRDFWKCYLGKRMSIACYVVEGGEKKLVALNACYVSCRGEDEGCEITGAAWKNVYDVLVYAEEKVDVYEHMGMDKVLKGLGLVVSKEYRGMKLGSKILDAREPLCRSQGIRGTATVFTGLVSQKSAARSGFTSLVEVTMSELASAGLDYPKDDQRSVKTMIKSFQF